MARKMRRFKTKSDMLPPVKTGLTPKAEEKPYKPGPDMGDIVAPPTSRTKCSDRKCIHDLDKHYGGPKGWCNVGGCLCQEFKI